MPSIFELIDAADADGLRALLESDPDAAAARDDQGLSALMRAAYRSPALLELVRAAEPPLDGFDAALVGVLERLGPPDAWSPDGFTALHLAAFGGQPAAARRLLEAGADPDAISRAPFAQVTPLGTAAFARSNDVARVLLEGGADPSRSGAGGGTPLHTAAMTANCELIALLLAHGADRRATTDEGKTPADLAPNEETVALLR